MAGFEARGFIFGAPLALQLKCAFVPLRKPGKLPGAFKRCLHDACVTLVPINSIRMLLSSLAVLLQARRLEPATSLSMGRTALRCILVPSPRVSVCCSLMI